MSVSISGNSDYKVTEMGLSCPPIPTQPGRPSVDGAVTSGDGYLAAIR